MNALREHLLRQLSNKYRDKLRSYEPGSLPIPDYSPKQETPMEMPDIEWEDDAPSVEAIDDGMPEIEWEDKQPSKDSSIFDRFNIPDGKIRPNLKDYMSGGDEYADQRADNWESAKKKYKELSDIASERKTFFNQPEAIPDYMLSEAVGMGSAIVGGLGALGIIPFKGVEAATRFIEKSAEVGEKIYSPKTKAAQRAKETVDWAFDKYLGYVTSSHEKSFDKIAADADKMIADGKLKKEKRQQYIDTFYNPVKRAIETGVAAFGPGMVVKAKGKGKGKGMSVMPEEIAAQAVEPPAPSPLDAGGMGLELGQDFVPQLERQVREGELLDPQEGISQDRPLIGQDPIEGELARTPDRIGEQRKLPGPREAPALPQPDQMKRLETDGSRIDQPSPSRLSPSDMIQAEIKRLTTKKAETKPEPEEYHWRTELAKTEPVKQEAKLIPVTPEPEKNQGVEVGDTVLGGDRERAGIKPGEFYGKVTGIDEKGNVTMKHEKDSFHEVTTMDADKFKRRGMKVVKPEEIKRESTKLRTVKSKMTRLSNKGDIDGLENFFKTVQKDKDYSPYLKKKAASHMDKLRQTKPVEDVKPKPVKKEKVEPLYDWEEYVDRDPVTQIQKGLDRGDDRIKFRVGDKDIELFRHEADKALKKKPKTPKALYNALGRTGNKSAAMEFLVHSDVKKVYGDSSGGVTPYLSEGKINVAGKDLEVVSSFDVKGKKTWSVIDPNSGLSAGAIDLNTKKEAIDTATTKLERAAKNHNIDDIFGNAAKRAKEQFMHDRNEDFDFQKEADKYAKGEQRRSHSDKIIKELNDSQGYKRTLDKDHLSKIKESAKRLAEMGVIKGDVLNLKRKSKHAADMSNKESRLFKDAVDEGFNSANKKKGSKGGLGGKQGGELNLSLLADAIEAAKNAGKAIYDRYYDVGKFLTFGPVEMLRDLNVSSAHKIADLISRPRTNRTGQPTKPDFFEREQVMAGKFAHKLDNIIEPLRTRVGRVGKKNNDIVMKLLEGIEVDATPQQRTAARQLREYLDTLHNYATNQGVEIGYLENYVPRVWDHIAIQKRPKKFKRFLEEKGLSSDAAKMVMHKILSNDGFLDDSGFGFDPNRKNVKPSYRHFKERSLTQITNDAAKDWIVHDLEPLLSVYTNNVANRVEYARTFGAGGEKLKELADNLMSQTKNKTDLQLDQEQMLKLLHNLSEAMLRRYNPIETPSLQRLSRWNNSLQVMSKLGTVSITSLMEFAAPVAIGRSASIPGFMKATLSAANETAARVSRLVTGKRRIDKTNFQENLENLGHVTVHALNQAISQRYGGKTGAMTARFMRIVMQEQMTNFQRAMTFGTAQSMLKRNAKYLAKKPNTRLAQDYRNQLIDMGIKPEEAVNWYNEGMPNNDFKKKAEIGSVTFVNRIIQKPNPATSPLMMFDEHFAFLTQFKKFTASYANNHLNKVVEEFARSKSLRGKLQYPLSLALSFAVGYFAVMQLKDLAKYGGSENNPYHNDDEVKKIIEAIDRAGISGWGTYGVALFSPRYGFWDSGAQRIVNLAGPGVSEAGKVLEVFAAEDKGKEASKFIARNTPLVNIYRPLRKEYQEGLEESIESVFGPSKKKPSKSSGWGSSKGSGWGSGKSSGW